MMKPLDNNQSYKGCPNLDQQCVLACTDKGLDFQVLFQSLEEHLYLPPVLIYGGYGGGSKVEMVRKENYLFLLFLVPDYYPSQRPRIFLSGHRTCHLYYLVAHDIPFLWYFSATYDFIGCILLHPCDKVDFLSSPKVHDCEIYVGHVHGNYGSGIKV